MIHSIRLQHYRSYTDDSFEFDPGVNIIVGPNASGKTNLLESIMVSCTGSSYRVADSELIQHDELWSRIDVQTSESSRTVKIEEKDGKAQKSFLIDDVVKKRLLPAVQVAYVFFEPNDLQLLHGSPERRREYIDGILEHIVPGFRTRRREYRRALAQRNALLKSGRATKDLLFVWNVRLSDLGGYIAEERKKLIDSMTSDVQSVYQVIAEGKDTINLRYESSITGASDYGSTMLRLLEERVQKDVERGFTSVGPHRDDMRVLLHGYDAKEVASRGETRTLVLALKVIEMQLLERAYNKKPLLLLDDVFSELDGARRRHLTNYLSQHQTFITTTDADIVVRHFMNKCHIIAISS